MRTPHARTPASTGKFALAELGYRAVNAPSVCRQPATSMKLRRWLSRGTFPLLPRWPAQRIGAVFLVRASSQAIVTGIRRKHTP